MTMTQIGVVGAGSVGAVLSAALRAAGHDVVAAAGGRIIVSPDCKPDVIARTKALGMQSWPGVFTPTEAFGALAAGADGLKLFPASMAGPSGLKAMRAVLPPGTYRVAWHVLSGKGDHVTGQYAFTVE